MGQAATSTCDGQGERTRRRLAIGAHCQRRGAGCRDRWRAEASIGAARQTCDAEVDRAVEAGATRDGDRVVHAGVACEGHAGRRNGDGEVAADYQRDYNGVDKRAAGCRNGQRITARRSVGGRRNGQSAGAGGGD